MVYSPVKVIEVSAWNRFVGAVALDPTTGVYAFEYDDSWIKNGAELAPLHMPRRSGIYEFPELSRQTFSGLPAMLADALPDRFGNALVDAWMAEHGVASPQITPLDRLAYASNRAMGALSFAPATGPVTGEVSVVQLADLVTAARAQLRGDLSDVTIHDSIASLISVGSSAGGARAKAVIAFNPATGQMRSGQLNAPADYEQWLLKLDGVGDPAQHAGDPLYTSQQFCRVEYAYYLMATRAGITMSESRLLPEGPRAHFMTKRFDRGPGNERLHSQTLCALGHLDFNLSHANSYSSYFTTAQVLGLGPDDFHEMFRRVVFNVMAVNHDDHAKNFSFLLPEHGDWQLAPAYDVTHSNWGDDWSSAHQMSVNGKFENISLDDLRALGDRHNVPGIEGVLKSCTNATHDWPEFAHEAGLDATTTAQIAGDLAAFAPR